MTTIRFGTDGWRGRIAEDYTFESVRRCTQGFAHYLSKTGNPGSSVVIGHDKRFLAEDFAAAAAEVMAANGFADIGRLTENVIWTHIMMDASF